MSEWQLIADAGGWIAPECEPIETKIDDDGGVRNVHRTCRDLWSHSDRRIDQ